ncbi:MAG: hypothetical protein Q8P18_13185 [Pseudomonadota bacterium]|nr:hypothetical protein [Pseudomonadota bacterium]
MRRSIASLLPCLFWSVATSLVATSSFFLHLHEALPGGRLSAAGQRAFWLPWQIYANVVSGRGLDDSSGFLAVPDVGLLSLVGNPATALFLAPVHSIGQPVLAHNLGLLLLVMTNAAGAWAFGETLRPRRRGLLAAAMVAGAGLWMAQLGQGALAAAWVGPGLAAVAALRAERRVGYYGALLAGLIGAPIVTAAILAGSRLVPGPRRSGLPIWVGVAVGLTVGFGLPAATAGADPHLPPSALVWLASGAALGMPLVFLLGLGALWRARGRSGQVAAALALVAVFVALGPLAWDPSGELVRVGDFAIPIAPALPTMAAHGQELLSGALVVAMIGALAWAGRARFGWLAELAAVAGLLLEPRAQAAFGQPVRLWEGEGWPVATALSDLGHAPYESAILQIPFLGVTEGLVGFVPFHRQNISGGPGLHLAGPVRDAVERGVSESRLLDMVSHLGDSADADFVAQTLGAKNLDLGPQLRRAGYGWLLVVGAEPGLRVAAQGALGAPVYQDSAYALWETPSAVLPGGGPGVDGAGGPPP